MTAIAERSPESAGNDARGDDGGGAEPGAGRCAERGRDRPGLRRGRRAAGRRFPGHRRAGRQVRGRAGLRHPPRRVWHRRHRDRHGDERPAPRRGDAVRRVRLSGLRADHQPPGEVSQPDQGPCRAARRDPDSLRRRDRGRGAPLRLLRGLLRPHRRPAGGHPGHARGRVRAAPAGDRMPGSRHLPRAQAPLLVQAGRGPGPRRRTRPWTTPSCAGRAPT